MDELIIRMLQGNASEAEADEVRAWRRLSVGNEKRYRELVGLWRATGLVQRHSVSTPGPSAQEIAKQTEPNVARVDRPNQKRRLRDRIHPVGRGLAAAALILLAIGIGKLAFDAGQRSSNFNADAVVTGEAERATVHLNDGSIIRLAPESRLRINGNGGREVWVDGRAYFAVTDKEGEPFEVRTRAGHAIVLGTRFEVRVHADSMRVTVLEGRVALTSGDEKVKVDAGEQSVATGGAKSTVSDPIEAQPQLAWLGHFLAFHATPLSEAARVMERRFEIDIRILDDSLARRTVTAWFNNQNAAEVLRALCRVADVHCTIEGGVASIGRDITGRGAQ